MVARYGHVVEKDLRVRPPPDAHPLAVYREALAHAPAPRADHERGTARGDLVELHRHELAGLIDPVGGRHRLAAALGARQQRAAALTVVGSLAVDEAALGAVQGHDRGPLPRSPVEDVARRRALASPRSLWTGWPASVSLAAGLGRALREDVRELLDVLPGDHYLSALVLVAQAVDELGTQDVDLAVQNAPPVGDLGLLLGQLADDIFEFEIRQRTKVGERVVHRGLFSSRGLAPDCTGRNCRRRRPEGTSIDHKVRLSLRLWLLLAAQLAKAGAHVHGRRQQRQRQA